MGLFSGSPPAPGPCCRLLRLLRIYRAPLALPFEPLYVAIAAATHSGIHADAFGEQQHLSFAVLPLASLTNASALVRLCRRCRVGCPDPDRRTDPPELPAW